MCLTYDWAMYVVISYVGDFYLWTGGGATVERLSLLRPFNPFGVSLALLVFLGHGYELD